MIKYHTDVVQGSEEWHTARLGIITASQCKLIITPTLKVADNEKCRAHLWELMAQRITGYVEPSYVSDDMLRGKDDEIFARSLYSEHYSPVREIGFVTNDKWGFTLGWSPDGLVDPKGGIECKSRRQRFQVETIVCEEVPAEYMPQLQTGILVGELDWIDFVSYSGGLEMITIRVEPDQKFQDAILTAAENFEKKLAENMAQYRDVSGSKTRRLIPTERRVEEEMVL